MDESCSSKYTYISCCLIILFNIIYLVFTLFKLFLQHQRRRRLPRQIQKMTDHSNELTTTISSRMATRSTTIAAATARITTTNNKNGYERLAQLYPHVNDEIHLPTKWNGKEKAPTLVLQQNDLIVTYKG